METADLNSSAYWESESVDLRLNPRRAVDVEGLGDFVTGELGCRASLIIATSGSSGAAKFVILPKAALLASARAVNEHGGLTPDDVWLANLPTFHVGGIAIYARSYANGARVVPMAWDAWTRDGSAFAAAAADSGATLASFTPTHLEDLVRAERTCPKSLRGVFLGGGWLDPVLVSRARALGWPLWPTYGMSEASSQIATSLEGAVDWLPLLPHWEARTDASRRLQLRGDALFAGYVRREAGRWIYDPARDGEGWFTTGDRCELRDGTLRFLARADGAVKVSGELVDLPSLDSRLAGLGISGLVVALPEARRGHELVLVCEGDAGGVLERFNAGLPPVERASRLVSVAALPRTALGKPDRAAIEAIAAGDMG